MPIHIEAIPAARAVTGKMCDETLSKLSSQVEHLAARQTAFEAVLLEVIAPILLQTIPDLALELVDAIRTDLHVTTSSGHSTLQLNTEKHLLPIGLSA